MGPNACTEHQCMYSTAIPLLPYGPYGLYRYSVPVPYSYNSTPLWAVRPVQSLSACTVQLYLYSPYGLYCLYRASVPVQYSYTSTPPMGRTARTEPQCLYKGALYHYLTTGLTWLHPIVPFYELLIMCGRAYVAISQWNVPKLNVDIVKRILI